MVKIMVEKKSKNGVFARIENYEIPYEIFQIFDSRETAISTSFL